MKQLLLSANGRIGRGTFWKGVLLLIVIGIAVSAANFLLAQVTGAADANGNFSVSGLAAIPFLLLDFGYGIVMVWAGICLGIKRYHDRGKSGAWVLIQLAPFIGPVWYFIEAGCLRGTVGPNAYGPDPLSATPTYTPIAA